LEVFLELLENMDFHLSSLALDLLKMEIHPLALGKFQDILASFMA